MASSFTIKVDGYDLSITWRADRDEWRRILESFKTRFGRLAEFDEDDKVWRLSLSQYDVVRRWALGHFESWQIHDGAQDRQRTETPPPQQKRAPTPLDGAFAALCLTPTAPPQLVTAAYRIMSQLAHPDRGGDHTSMVMVNHAVEMIRKHQGVRQ